MKLIACLMLLALAPFAVAQNKSDAGSNMQASLIHITEKEQEQVAQSIRVLNARSQEFNQAVGAAVNASLECPKAIESLARVQTAYARLETARAEHRAVLAGLQAAYGCKACELAQDGKTLQREKPKTQE